MSRLSRSRTRAASQLPTSRNEPPYRRRRRVALGAIVITVAAIAVVVASTLSGGGGSVPTTSPTEVAQASGRLRIELNGRTLIDRPTARLDRAGSRSALLERVPATLTISHGPARIRARTDRRTLGREIDRTVAAGGGVVTVAWSPLAASIRIPVVKQTLQDDCEVTALSMLLRFAGTRVGQLALQRQVAHSRPLDPELGGEGEIWGDPGRGFVGRADGGGPAGGFGVYQGPIAALARKHGLDPRDLTGRRPKAIYRTLLAGKPVMVWVGLSEGPYASWHSPTGAPIEVNYGEHAVLLTGVTGAAVTVNDPLSGQRLTWPKEHFEAMWDLLGNRALAA